MTTIANFGANPKHINHSKAYKALMAKGNAIDGTDADGRKQVEGAAEFAISDSVQVFTNRNMQRVIQAEEVTGDKVDYNYLPENVDGEIERQTYRSMLKPDKFGVMHLTERVDSRDADNKVIASWIREVESDPNSEAFSIYFP